MFSVCNPSSFENIRQKWFPEVNHHWPKGHLILVGTKSDLRDDVSMAKRLKDKEQWFVSQSAAEALAKEIDAICYIEVSSKCYYNLDNLFKVAVAAGITPRDTIKKQKNCIMQ